MKREELLKALKPLEWKKSITVRDAYKANIAGQLIFVSMAGGKGCTSFDDTYHETLEEAKAAAEEYLKAKILSHFNIEEQ